MHTGRRLIRALQRIDWPTLVGLAIYAAWCLSGPEDAEGATAPPAAGVASLRQLQDNNNARPLAPAQGGD